MNAMFANTSEIFNAIADAAKYNIHLKNLPKVVVIGDQTSGKSSLLEALCGVSDILPKKDGLATKKPVNITLVRGDCYKFFVEGDEFSTPEETYSKINNLNNSCLTSIINVKIVSPDVYDMSFIDTPGLVQMSDEGIDPRKIKSIIVKYLEDPNNIFIIVASAAADVATCAAIKLVHKYKRQQDCIGILTKMDLVETQGKNGIYDILAGRKYCLGYGWGCVRLRSDSDISRGVTIYDNIQVEHEYLNSLPTIRDSMAGVPKIKATISNIQFSRIGDNIPRIITELDAKVANLENSKTFLEKMINDPQEEMAEKLVEIFKKLVKSSIDRANFDMQLKEKIKEGLLNYMYQVYKYKANYKTNAPKSSLLIEAPIFDYHHYNKTRVDNIKDNALHSIFCNGNLYQISINSDFRQAYKNETDLAMMFGVFEFNPNVESTKKKDWVQYLEKYFSALHKDNTLQDIVYNITEKMIIEHITSNDKFDEVTVKFSEYLVKEIGSKSYEANIKYSINNLIKIEEEPNLNMMEIIRELVQIIDPDQLELDNGWIWKKNANKIKIDLYSELFNIAYLRYVINNVAYNCYRIVIVNLVEKMIYELLTVVLSLNKENVVKENAEINAKISALLALRNILSNYLRGTLPMPSVSSEASTPQYDQQYDYTNTEYQ
jgi:GTP-binding protein EngB required for normal cell division